LQAVLEADEDEQKILIDDAETVEAKLTGGRTKVAAQRGAPK
jgi:hypothetical protein